MNPLVPDATRSIRPRFKSLWIRVTQLALRATPLILLPIAFAITAAAGDAPTSADARPGVVAGDATDYVVHEWGTFTTVSGSDGALVPGLERDEEQLPEFVYAHEGMGWDGGKGWTRPLANVTVKLETPVIYFYSKLPLAARVEVLFRGGSISQWFPDRTAGEVPPPRTSAPGRTAIGVPPAKPTADEAPDRQPALPPAAIDFAQGYDGSIAWDIDVLPRAENHEWLTWQGTEDLTWVAPRHVDANILATARGEYERYLFYRGVGNFDLPVQFSAPEPNSVRVANIGAHEVPFMLVFRHLGDHFTNEIAGASLPIGGYTRSSQVHFGVVTHLAPGAVHDVALSTLSTEREWRPAVYRLIAGALTDAGLFPKESDAMVQTWWRSYFEAEGLRIFWIVPRPVVDEILPLEITPSPSNIERVILGRAEILTPEFESSLPRFVRANPGHRYINAYSARLAAIRAGND